MCCFIRLSETGSQQSKALRTATLVATGKCHVLARICYGEHKVLNGFDKILIGVMTLVLMVGMGASLSTEDYRRALRQPRAILIGLLSQFGWMPLLAFLAIRWLGLQDTEALGLLLMACAPGGNASNMFAFFSKADLALSVSMTAVSTLVSVLLTPTLLLAYASSSSQAELQVPFLPVMGTLLFMLLPIALGMWARARSIERARRLERIGALAGVVLLALLLVSSVAKHIELVLSAEDRSLVACLLVTSSGMVLGYLVARLAKLFPRQRQAVSLETGVQNTPLVIAIILACFPAAEHDALLKLPFLYAMTALLVGTCATFVYRRFPYA